MNEEQRALIIQVTTLEDTIFACLREDYKMEIGFFRPEVKQ